MTTVIPSLSKKASEQTDHGQSQSLDHRNASRRCRRSGSGSRLQRGDGRSSGADGGRLARATAISVSSMKESMPKRRKQRHGWQKGCAAAAAASSVGWWLSSLGYTVPSEISVR